MLIEPGQAGFERLLSAEERGVYAVSDLRARLGQLVEDGPGAGALAHRKGSGDIVKLHPQVDVKLEDVMVRGEEGGTTGAAPRLETERFEERQGGLQHRQGLRKTTGSVEDQSALVARRSDRRESPSR